MTPKPQTRAQLIAALRSIADSVEANDSFEGSISYEITGRNRFNVQAVWCVGNSGGQGGVILIGKTEKQSTLTQRELRKHYE